MQQPNSILKPQSHDVKISIVKKTWSLFFVLMCFQLYATEDTQLDYLLDEVIIEGERLQIPFSGQNRDIVVLDVQQIEKLPVQSLHELLSYVAGIDIKQRSPWGGQTDLNINGGTFDQTLVLINGIKIIDPQTGHNMMNLPISPHSIQRIEIVKGPAASKYGIHALNGAINIITKQPDGKGLFVHVNTGSSFEKDTSNQKLYGAISTELNTHFATAKTKNYLSFNTIQSTGHRYNTSINNSKLLYTNHIQINPKGSLNMLAGWAQNKFGANGFYAPPGDIESIEEVRTIIAGIDGQFLAKDKWTIKPAISFRNNYDHYIYTRKNPSVYENKHKTQALNLSLNNSIYTRGGQIGIGLEYRSEWINSNSLGKWHRDNFGLFAEYNFNLLDDFSFQTGAYLNYSKHFGWNLLPSLDVGYQISPSWRIFANIGSGIRTPTYTDWYYTGPVNLANPYLKPEKAMNIEGGVKFNQGNLSIHANYFYRITNDFIDWVKDSLEAPWQPDNFQKIKMHGLSTSADYRLIKKESERDFSLVLGLGYTYLNPKATSNEDQSFKISQYALNHLKHQYTTRLQIDFLQNYSWSALAKVEQRIHSSYYFVLDSKIAGQWKGFHANISIQNITNKKYFDFNTAPLPGRWMSVGVGYQI